MPIAPIITFKAGQCEADTSTPIKVKPQAQPGYIYLYSEDDLVHFCWRRRNASLENPELDLVMVPTDGRFVPYETSSSQTTAKTNGRVCILKFASSSQRYFFWMQSKSQSRSGNASWFSGRDRKIVDVVHRLLQGEEVNVASELAAVRNIGDRQDDEAMEDVESHRGRHDHRGGGSGGAGPDAIGEDIREEGEGPREGGADGARAASSSTPDAASAVRNFLESLRSPAGPSSQQQKHADFPYPHLSHLLPASITVAMVDTATPEYADLLISSLPPAVVVLSSDCLGLDGHNEPSAEALAAAKASLSLEDKRGLLKKVLRSPQFHQALESLTMALQDGGLPSVAEAMGIKIENNGYLKGREIPMGGGNAVKAFVEGAQKKVQDEQNCKRAYKHS